MVELFTVRFLRVKITLGAPSQTMTIENEIQSLWQLAKVTDETTMLLVPTGQLLKGNDITATLREIKQECVKSSVVSSSTTATSLVEESVLVTIHDKVLNWLLPGVKPTNRRLVVPLVVFLQFQAEQLVSIRLYWDQASVLTN